VIHGNLGRKLIFLLFAFFIIFSLIEFIKPQVKSSDLTGPVVVESAKGADSQVKGVETAYTNVPVGNRVVYFGMWTQGFFDPSSGTLHPEVLKAVEDKIGKRAAIAHYYRGWEELDSAGLLAEIEIIYSNGWRPMISANPYFFDRCSSGGLPFYRAIAQGRCDDYLKSVGRNLKQFAKPLFLRFAWEMNVGSMEWEIGRTGSSNEDFKAAWRKIHDVVYAEGATNVLWVFAPDVGNLNYADIYPGDAYVDWIALDGYNWGTTQPWSQWHTFSQVFSSAYRQITSVSANKPLMLSEVNTTDVGGDKAGWYKDMLSDQIPNNFPAIKAVVFYNENRESKENVNWVIDVSAESLNSFSQNIKNEIYASSF